jgi:hypothetical protein
MHFPVLAGATGHLDQLAERTVQSRAVEAVTWGMPAVDYDGGDGAGASPSQAGAT